MAVSRRLLAISTAGALVLASLSGAASATAAELTSIAGTITAPADAEPSVDLWLLTDGEWAEAGSVAPDRGTYVAGPIAAGQYRVSFSDAAELYPTQFYPGIVTDDPEDDRITTIAVADGQAVTAINGTLAVVSLASMPTPVISGDLTVGSELEASLGGWEEENPVGISYTWLRNGKAVYDESELYELTEDDLGKSISVVAEASGQGYTTERRTSVSVKISAGALSAKAPKIKGKLKVGKKLKAVAGSWSESKVVTKYQWFANGKAIKGATKKILALKAAQAGKKISVKVTGTKGGFAKAVVSSKKTKKVAK